MGRQQAWERIHQISTNDSLRGLLCPQTAKGATSRSSKLLPFQPSTPLLLSKPFISMSNPLSTLLAALPPSLPLSLPPPSDTAPCNPLQVGWVTVHATEPISSGVHEWSIKIESQGETSDGSGLMLGIVPKTFNRYDSFISQGGGWSVLSLFVRPLTCGPGGGGLENCERWGARSWCRRDDVPILEVPNPLAA